MTQKKTCAAAASRPVHWRKLHKDWPATCLTCAMYMSELTIGGKRKINAEPDIGTLQQGKLDPFLSSPCLVGVPEPHQVVGLHQVNHDMASMALPLLIAHGPYMPLSDAAHTDIGTNAVAQSTAQPF